jgi:metacaspase-1
MPQGLSLHIGLNSVDPGSYAGWDGRLVACENDARDMHRIASSLGYTSRILLTQEATRTAVLNVLADATSQLQRDDIFLLSYSGHGGQVDDLNGDEPDDGKDETWVLYDAEVVDDELHELYTRFKPGVRIVVLSDSCHSGTITRATFERTAVVEAEEGVRNGRLVRSKRIDLEIESKVHGLRARELRDIQESTRGAMQRTPEATVILISGCQDNQLSADGDVNGLFTQNLLKVWDSGNFDQDYRHFQRAIKKRMPPSQQPKYFVVGAPNAKFEHQRPFTVKSTTAKAMRMAA